MSSDKTDPNIRGQKLRGRADVDSKAFGPLVHPGRTPWLDDARGTPTLTIPAANDNPLTEVRSATVLVVDDEPVNVRVIRECLGDEFELLVVHDGASALRIALSDSPPDLILLDVEMPDMSGYDVCGLLKSHPKARDIPVIFVTVLDETHEEARGLELGAADYICKPIRPAILQARVRTHLRLKHRADQLESLACIDALTQLSNRRGFDRYLDVEWRRAARERTNLAVVMIDVDCFKAYNDELGHAAGDKCLQVVSAQMQRCLKRPADRIARYGGEEFAAILPSTDDAGATIVSELLRAAVEQLGLMHPTSSISSVVTVSLGAASIVPRADMSPRQLLEVADRRLYTAKSRGRNRVCGGRGSLQAVHEAI